MEKWLQVFGGEGGNRWGGTRVRGRIKAETSTFWWKVKVGRVGGGVRGKKAEGGSVKKK